MTSVKTPLQEHQQVKMSAHEFWCFHYLASEVAAWDVAQFTIKVQLSTSSAQLLQPLTVIGKAQILSNSTDQQLPIAHLINSQWAVPHELELTRLWR